MPLRQLGTFFHSSMEGVTAANTVLDLPPEDRPLDISVPAPGPGRR